MSYIARSVSTGKYHLGHSVNTTSCNYSGQNRTARNRAAQLKEIEAAGEHAFCSKCFKHPTRSLKENALWTFQYLANKAAS